MMGDDIDGKILPSQFVVNKSRRNIETHGTNFSQVVLGIQPTGFLASCQADSKECTSTTTMPFPEIVSHEHDTILPLERTSASELVVQNDQHDPPMTEALGVVLAVKPAGNAQAQYSTTEPNHSAANNDAGVVGKFLEELVKRHPSTEQMGVHRLQSNIAKHSGDPVVSIQLVDEEQKIIPKKIEKQFTEEIEDSIGATSVYSVNTFGGSFWSSGMPKQAPKKLSYHQRTMAREALFLWKRRAWHRITMIRKGRSFLRKLHIVSKFHSKARQKLRYGSAAWRMRTIDHNWSMMRKRLLQIGHEHTLTLRAKAHFRTRTWTKWWAALRAIRFQRRIARLISQQNCRRRAHQVLMEWRVHWFEKSWGKRKLLAPSFRALRELGFLKENKAVHLYRRTLLKKCWESLVLEAQSASHQIQKADQLYFSNKSQKFFQNVHSISQQHAQDRKRLKYANTERNTSTSSNAICTWREWTFQRLLLRQKIRRVKTLRSRSILKMWYNHFLSSQMTSRERYKNIAAWSAKLLARRCLKAWAEETLRERRGEQGWQRMGRGRLRRALRHWRERVLRTKELNVRFHSVLNRKNKSIKAQAYRLMLRQRTIARTGQELQAKHQHVVLLRTMKAWKKVFWEHHSVRAHLVKRTKAFARLTLWSWREIAIDMREKRQAVRFLGNKVRLHLVHRAWNRLTSYSKRAASLQSSCMKTLWNFLHRKKSLCFLHWRHVCDETAHFEDVEAMVVTARQAAVKLQMLQELHRHCQTMRRRKAINADAKKFFARKCCKTFFRGLDDFWKKSKTQSSLLISTGRRRNAQVLTNAIDRWNHLCNDTHYLKKASDRSTALWKNTRRVSAFTRLRALVRKEQCKLVYDEMAMSLRRKLVGQAFLTLLHCRLDNSKRNNIQMRKAVRFSSQSDQKRALRKLKLLAAWRTHTKRLQIKAEVLVRSKKVQPLWILWKRFHTKETKLREKMAAALHHYVKRLLGQALEVLRSQSIQACKATAFQRKMGTKLLSKIVLEWKLYSSMCNQELAKVTRWYERKRKSSGLLALRQVRDQSLMLKEQGLLVVDLIRVKSIQKVLLAWSEAHTFLQAERYFKAKVLRTWKKSASFLKTQGASHLKMEKMKNHESILYSCLGTFFSFPLYSEFFQAWRSRACAWRGSRKKKERADVLLKDILKRRFLRRLISRVTQQSQYKLQKWMALDRWSMQLKNRSFWSWKEHLIIHKTSSNFFLLRRFSRFYQMASRIKYQKQALQHAEKFCNLGLLQKSKTAIATWHQHAYQVKQHRVENAQKEQRLLLLKKCVLLWKMHLQKQKAYSNWSLFADIIT